MGMKTTAVSQILHLPPYHTCAAKEKEEKGIFFILELRCTNNASLNSEEEIEKQRLLSREFVHSKVNPLENVRYMEKANCKDRKKKLTRDQIWIAIFTTKVSLSGRAP